MIEQDFIIVFFFGGGGGAVFVTACAFKSSILIHTRHGNVLFFLKFLFKIVAI